MAVPADTSSRLKATTAFLAIAAGLISFTSLEFMLVAVQEQFALSANGTIVVAQIAAGTSLLAVFAAGALGDRLGNRRVLVSASLVYCLGAVIVGLAPHTTLLIIGLSLGGIGSITMTIIGLSILNQTFPAKAQRARAFGLFAVIAPVVAIVVPLLSSAIVPRLGWRPVAIVWVAVGLTVFFLATRSLPTGGDDRVRSELFTPALAGLTLSAVALTFSFATANAHTSAHQTFVRVSAITAVVAFLALAILMRRLPKPTLDIRSLKSPGSFPILFAVMVVNGVNLFFFTFLLLQYRYHQTLLETAVILIVPQCTAAGGAVIGGRLSARWGSVRTAISALVLASIAALGALTVTAEASPWLPVVILAIAAVPIAAAVGPLTQSFMDLAPAEGSGSASSVRNSAANLGVAIGGLISGLIIFNDLDADTERNIEAYRQQADAFHLAGAICFGAYLAAAALVFLHSRRADIVMRTQRVEERHERRDERLQSTGH